MVQNTTLNSLIIFTHPTEAVQMCEMSRQSMQLLARYNKPRQSQTVQLAGLVMVQLYNLQNIELIAHDENFYTEASLTSSFINSWQSHQHTYKVLSKEYEMPTNDKIIYAVQIRTNH